ncbi:MAG: hypothetical protein HY238_28410 [Acidobacteria bacterium]|nr:hypothetical protein [Acidobacteriota bacterium]
MRRREFLSLPAAALADGKGALTLGAYSSPKPFWERGARLDEFGINAVLVGSGAIDDALLRRARAEGARVFAEFAAFNGSGWLKDGRHSDAWPVDETGKPSPKQTWFLGVCPTNEEFLRWRLAELEKLVSRYSLDGVWLDYMHWHAQFEDPQPGLPETCFNASCLERFRRDTGLHVSGAADILGRHERAWREWRCSIVVDFARRVRAVLARHAPKMLLGNFQCAWRDDEHDGARRRILGLDLPALAKVFDVLSPMVYHGRSGRPVEWVRQNVEWLAATVGGVKVWPIVQAWSDPHGHKVSAGEFEHALRGGLSGGASGVMMFTIGAVAEDPEKMDVLKRVYRGLAA